MYGIQSVSDTGSGTTSLFSPVLIIPPTSHNIHRLIITVVRRKSGLKMVTIKNSNAVSIPGRGAGYKIGYFKIFVSPLNTLDPNRIGHIPHEKPRFYVLSYLGYITNVIIYADNLCMKPEERRISESYFLSRSYKIRNCGR